MTGSVTVAAPKLERVLVFSKTGGFRHDSIPQGIAAIQALGTANGFTVVATEDATAFTAANLATFDVVVFMSTTGEILNDAQQTAFEGYIKAGGGFAGVHAASDTEYSWPWFGELVGGYFRNHPAGTPTADVKIEDADEPSTAGLPATWTRVDEWYNFQHPVTPAINGNTTVADYSPRARQVKVLATVDESTYGEDDGNTIDDDHPVAWCSDFDGGRSWYTAMGHTQASFSDAQFRAHLLGGLRTAAGVAGDCGKPRTLPPTADDFEKITINNDTNAPMEIDIANDGRAFYIELDGRVQMWNPTTRATTTVGTIPVTLSHENGLLGIQLARELRHDRPHLPRLLGAAGLHQPEPRLALHADRQHARPGADHLHLAAPAPGVLPHRRLARVGRQRRPLHLHGRQHQPVRARLQPDGRAARPRDLGRPAHVGQHERPERQDPAHPADPERHRRAGRRHDVHDPAGQHVPRGHGARPCPRSTRWASGTRSGSTTTRRPAGS